MRIACEIPHCVRNDRCCEVAYEILRCAQNDRCCEVVGEIEKKGTFQLPTEQSKVAALRMTINGGLKSEPNLQLIWEEKVFRVFYI